MDRNPPVLPGGQPSQELIGTRGDRTAIAHITWTGEPGGSEFDIELTLVVEVDAEGKQRAVIRFDPDDRRAAFEEAEIRFAAGEAAAIGGQAPIAAMVRAFRRHDWEALRACLAEDAVICDRRAFGILGTLDRDQWVGSLKELADLAPDLDSESLRILAWSPHGRVSMSRQFGTRDGGPFESLLINVFLTDGDRVQRNELFDVDAADAALARFAELCAEP